MPIQILRNLDPTIYPNLDQVLSLDLDCVSTSTSLNLTQSPFYCLLPCLIIQHFCTECAIQLKWHYLAHKFESAKFQKS